MDFSRVRPPVEAPTNVHPLLDESLKLAEHQANLQSIEVVREYAKNLPLVMADPAQLKQVFVNVILNAVQAMPLEGRLILRTKAAEDQIEILIQDTGVGIPAEEIQKVFDPFYTSKPVGVGTGLGLSLSYTIIQRHQGKISIASEVGKGTTLRILLPVLPPG
ncbi:MAG: hypothetical protein HYZ90_03975 [Candidatus Omnitrophica bacterium]|nr:hypothetical protein [Candidatus Omnitrophota bacterium]